MMKMREATQLDTLDIVAYGDRLEPRHFPSIVPPVFRTRGAKPKLLVQPFRLEDGRVIGGTWRDADDLERWTAREEVTPIEPRAALPGHELWVDEAGKVRYEPMGEVRKRLDALAMRSLQKAEDALAKGDYKVADRYARRASNACPAMIEPLAMMIVVSEARGRHEESCFLYGTLHDNLLADALDRLIECYRVEVRHNGSVSIRDNRSLSHTSADKSANSVHATISDAPKSARNGSADHPTETSQAARSLTKKTNVIKSLGDSLANLRRTKTCAA